MTLDRLEKMGLLTSYLTDPTPERGGRAKRCHTLTKPARGRPSLAIAGSDSGGEQLQRLLPGAHARSGQWRQAFRTLRT